MRKKLAAPSSSSHLMGFTLALSLFISLMTVLYLTT